METDSIMEIDLIGMAGLDGIRILASGEYGLFTFRLMTIRKSIRMLLIRILTIRTLP